MRQYTEFEKGLLRELAQIEEILAEALGYTHDEEYGWAIGDHTPVTLAMEVRRRGVKVPAAGHLGVAEESCPLRHAAEKAHLAEVELPCPNCGAAV